jgi:hypothetical protein
MTVKLFVEVTLSTAKLALLSFSWKLYSVIQLYKLCAHGSKKRKKMLQQRVRFSKRKISKWNGMWEQQKEEENGMERERSRKRKRKRKRKRSALK